MRNGAFHRHESLTQIFIDGCRGVRSCHQRIPDRDEITPVMFVYLILSKARPPLNLLSGETVRRSLGCIIALTSACDSSLLSNCLSFDWHRFDHVRRRGTEREDRAEKSVSAATPPRCSSSVVHGRHHQASTRHKLR